MSHVAALRALLTAKRILIVEDEYLVAAALKGILESCGASTVGPAHAPEQAAALAESDELEGAILDINLNGALIYDVADRLRGRQIPIVFATGYAGLDTMPARFRDVPVVIKPFDLAQLSAAFQQAFG